MEYRGVWADLVIRRSFEGHCLLGTVRPYSSERLITWCFSKIDVEIELCYKTKGNHSSNPNRVRLPVGVLTPCNNHTIHWRFYITALPRGKRVSGPADTVAKELPGLTNI